MQTVVRNLTNNSTITMPGVFNSYPLSQSADKDFSYASMPAADLDALVKLAKQGKISFPGSTGKSIPAGLPVMPSPFSTYVLNDQEPIGVSAGSPGYWSINDNCPRVFNGAIWLSSTASVSSLIPAESWAFASNSGTNNWIGPCAKLSNGEIAVYSEGSSFGGAGNPAGDLQIYTPSTNQWRYATRLPAPARYIPALIGLASGKLLLAGGFGPRVTNDPTSAPIFQDSWLYDVTTNAWEQVGNLPKASYFSHGSQALIELPAGGLHGGKVLSVAGVNRDDNPIGQYPQVCQRDTFIYNQIAKTWDFTRNAGNTITKMDEGVANCGIALTAGGKVVAVGGRRKVPGIPVDYSNKVQVFDPLTGIWTSYAMPDADTTLSGAAVIVGDRGGCTVSNLPDGRVLICGGLTNRSTGIFVRKSSLIFNLDTLSFASNRGVASDQTVIDIVTERGFHAAYTRADGQIMLVGGFDQNFLNTAECDIYDATSDSFVSTTPMPAKHIHSATGTPLSYFMGLECAQNAITLNNGNLLFGPHANKVLTGQHVALIFVTGTAQAIPYPKPAFDESTRSDGANQNFPA